MPLKQIDRKERKRNFLLKVYKLLSKHDQIVVAFIENVGSLQVQQIRKIIQENGGELIIGKNTVIRKAIELKTEELPNEEQYQAFKKYGPPKPELKALKSLLKQKVGFIFSDEPIYLLKQKIEANKVEAPARVGVIAPADVIIPPGPTGMDPSQINFFHALQVSTKIQKGQIEIVKDYKVCTEGKKIGTSEVTLLQRMNIKPFSYNMIVFTAYDNGAILDKDVINISPNDILDKFKMGVKNLTALSLESGIPTELSVPHFVTNAFKNLAAIGMQIDYKFAQLAQASESKVEQKVEKKVEKEVKKEEKKEEKPAEEEEEDIDMGGLFD